MLQVSMDGPNVNCDILKLHSSIAQCPANRTDGNRLGKSTKFYIQCGKYSMNHPQGEIFISGKMVVTRCCTRNLDMGEDCPDCEVLAFIVKK